MDRPITLYTIRATEMLSLGVIVLFFGIFLNRRIAFPERNSIPPAVTGGLLLSLLTWFIHEQLDIELQFDLSIRDLLLLVFFSTIGLSTRLRMPRVPSC